MNSISKKPQITHLSTFLEGREGQYYQVQILFEEGKPSKVNIDGIEFNKKSTHLPGGENLSLCGAEIGDICKDCLNIDENLFAYQNIGNED